MTVYANTLQNALYAENPIVSHTQSCFARIIEKPMVVYQIVPPNINIHERIVSAMEDPLEGRF